VRANGNHHALAHAFEANTESLPEVRGHKRISDRHLAMNKPRPLTRLQRGMVVMLNGAEHVVDLVNETRARCVPMRRVRVDFYDRGGNACSFEHDAAAISISPNSEIKIVRWLKANGRRAAYNNNRRKN
jgi:hypothetical protein